MRTTLPFVHRRPVPETLLVWLTCSGVEVAVDKRKSVQNSEHPSAQLTLCVWSPGFVCISCGSDGGAGGPSVRTEQEQPHELCVRWRQSQREVWISNENTLFAQCSGICYGALYNTAVWLSVDTALFFRFLCHFRCCTSVILHYRLSSLLHLIALYCYLILLSDGSMCKY